MVKGNKKKTWRDVKKKNRYEVKEGQGKIEKTRRKMGEQIRGENGNSEK